MKSRSFGKNPLVSVVMPVYNARPYLAGSIGSILNQTFSNFEFIIIDDGSTDGSYGILQQYEKLDPRIKLLHNKYNRGVSSAVKKAIAAAKGKFLARMDADDIAVLERLETQVRYLQNHKKTVAVGAQCAIIDAEGNIIGKKIFPQEHKDIYKYIFAFIPLQQPTLMIDRRKLPKNFSFYEDGQNTAEEVALLFKLFNHGNVENLNQVLLLYRLHGKNTSLSNIRKTFFQTLKTRVKAIFIYSYKPTLSGIVWTILESIGVLFLPQKLVFFLYKKLRALTNGGEPAKLLNRANLRSASY